MYEVLYTHNLKFKIHWKLIFSFDLILSFSFSLSYIFQRKNNLCSKKCRDSLCSNKLLVITWHSGCSSVSGLSLFSLKNHQKRVNIHVLFPWEIITYDILYILFRHAIQFHHNLLHLQIGRVVHHIQHLRGGLPSQERPQVLVNLKPLWFHHICMVLCYIPKNIRKYIE